MKKINVLGNFSGRNAGDAAILGCLLRDISAVNQNVHFLIPTINPQFIRRSYSQYSISPVSLLPWNFSAKILGLPVVRATLNADLVLVTDAILFDRKLYNPLFNYLWTLSWLLPMAKKRNIPVVLYNASIGTIHTEAGRKCLEKVIRSSSAMILRDKESLNLVEQMTEPLPRIFEGADCALNAIAVDEKRFGEIKQKEDLFGTQRPVIGFNINSYVDVYVRKKSATFGRKNLVHLYALVINRIIDNLDADIILVETQHMDLGIARETLQKIARPDRVRMLSNRDYSYEDICAVLKRMELFVGMRTHSLILSAAMGVPPIGIVTYPKNRGFMRTIGMEKQLIEFDDLTAEKFSQIIIDGFNNRQAIRAFLIPQVQKEKNKASHSATLLQELNLL
jgi:polysaccharide pyruvyl transferase WcaK-like protein